jgi:hypothetical protein
MNQILKAIILLIPILSLQISAAVQESKLNANDASAQAYFGSAVSVSGNTAVVGAYNNLRDDETQRDGAAYIYEFNGSSWQQVDKLLPINPWGLDAYGTSVSISNNRIAIGAPKSLIQGAGAIGGVYIYEYDGSDWLFKIQINASDSASNDNFGASVSLDGDRLVVGASSDFITGVGSTVGSAYIFDFDGSNWNETQKILASDASASSSFGIASALEGNRLVIGASSVDDAVLGNNLGAAYVYELIQNTWTETTILTAIDRQTNDKFGNKVSLSGDNIIIGSKESAYIFEYNTTHSTWSQGINLAPDDNMANDRFGDAVAIDGNKALVGAREDDDNGNGAGSVYAFIKNSSNNWVQVDFITHTDSPVVVGDNFGSAVGLDGSRAIIGSNRDDNGENQTFDTGAAYVFDLDIKPQAVNDSITVLEDSQWVSIVVLSNDTDVDGGPIFIESFTQPGNGEVENEDNILSYKPSENYCNSDEGTDSISYTLNGGSSATVSLIVTCVDDAPIAVPDSVMMLEDGNPVIIQVLANDTDIDDGLMNIVSVSQPSNGTVINNSNTLSYEPNPNYCNTNMATDEFTYTLNGNSSTTVSILVECVDDLPVAVDDFASVNEDNGPTVINILDNDTDIDDGPMILTGFSQPNHADVFDNNFSVTYRPDANYCNQGSATDDFTYTINNNSTAEVAIEVKCVNDQPSFSIVGDIYSDSLMLNQSQLLVANFANNFVFGPSNESSQQVLQFNTVIDADDADVIESISIDNNGQLDINFTQNTGVAMVSVSMQDNGGIENGGNDISNSIAFYVTFSDTVFSNGFEQQCCIIPEDLVNNIAYNNLDKIVPTYDFNSHSIEFYGFVLELNQGYPNNPSFNHIKQWLKAILILVDSETDLNM